MGEPPAPEVSLTRDSRGVATITVAGRKGLNLIGSPQIEALRLAFGSLQDDEGLRVAVLTGAGERAFIGGADIAEMAGLDAGAARSFITKLHEACQAIRDLPVPVVAKIRGHCLGGGLEIAASCDLRVASQEARFAMPEVRVGLPSVIEAALLPALVGWGKAREMLYTGDSLGAEKALACGLIEKVVPAAKLDGAVEKWTQSLLAAGPRAIREQKRLFRQWEQMGPSQAIEAGIGAFGRAFETDEPQRMLQAFLERKRPQD